MPNLTEQLPQEAIDHSTDDTRRLPVRNWPHAARMSRPRGPRTGEENPESLINSAKRSITLLLLVSNVPPDQGSNGITFTLAGTPVISRTSSRARPSGATVAQAQGRMHRRFAIVSG